MANYKKSKVVHREAKKGTDILKFVMVFMTVLTVLMAIAFSTGYMMFAFIFAGMYMFFEASAGRDYEYTLEDNVLTIEVVKAKRSRSVRHVLDLSKLEVVAPHNHEAVKMYKKGASEEKIRKFDYSSYDNSIMYYTMIIFDGNEKIKLLLDLDEDMLKDIKKRYPSKVFLVNS